MFAYWCLKDLRDLVANEGVKFVRGRTFVASRVIGVEGMALANSQTVGRLKNIQTNTGSIAYEGRDRV